MNPHSVYNNILRRKNPADLHARTLDGDWSQKQDDQLQITKGQAIKIRIKNPRLK